MKQALKLMKYYQHLNSINEINFKIPRDDSICSTPNLDVNNAISPKFILSPNSSSGLDISI